MNERKEQRFVGYFTTEVIMDLLEVPKEDFVLQGLKFDPARNMITAYFATTSDKYEKVPEGRESYSYQLPYLEKI